MTVMDILKEVYREYKGDTEYPDFQDDDMQLYFGYLQDALNEWLRFFPSDTVPVPDEETDPVTVVRRRFIVEHILSKLTPEDEDGLVKANNHESKRLDEVRLERIIRLRINGKTPTQTGMENRGAGTGFGILESETL